MTEYTSVPVPSDLPRDEGIGAGAELTCEVCGIPLEYKGRGRKPTRCDEHKKNGSKSAGTASRKANATNQRLAEQAADVLKQANDLLAMAASMPFVRMDGTAEAITNANPVFREMATEALLTDPALAKKILTAGGMSGRMALILAYGMFGMAVAPVAYMEIKNKQQAVSSGNVSDRAEGDGAVNAA